MLTHDLIFDIARKAWSPRIQSLRILARFVRTSDLQDLGEDTWHVTKDGDDLKIINETYAQAEADLATWSRLLGRLPVWPSSDPRHQSVYLRGLRKQVEKLGDAALATIGESGTACASRPRRAGRGLDDV